MVAYVENRTVRQHGRTLRIVCYMKEAKRKPDRRLLGHERVSRTKCQDVHKFAAEDFLFESENQRLHTASKEKIVASQATLTARGRCQQKKVKKRLQIL